MKLRTQIIALGLAGVLLAGAVGGIGLASTSALKGAIRESIQAGQALQASQEADMMHDAIRGDAQLAQFGVLEKNAQRVTEAEEGLATHSKTFREALAKLGELPISSASRDELGKTSPLVNAYIETAQRMISSARSGGQVDEKSVSALQAAFTELEKQMATLSDTIEKNGEALNARADDRVSQTLLAIGVSLALATAAIAALALWLARAITRPMTQAVEVAERLAQGDLSSDIHPTGNDETIHLLSAMASMQTSFTAIVRGVKSNAEWVATASTQMAQGNQDLSGRTEQQASALQQTAATMEQLGTTVRHNAENARQANQLAHDATTVAAEGGQVVGRVVSTMRDINDSSRRIADILGVIDGIAFQTNILALNAAVEAARAGEQGRGFAVVAAEVRTLAQRSAEAAKEIKALIGRSVGQVEQGTGLVDQAGRTMNEIVTSIQRVSAIVAEITSASAEQSSGVQQVGQAVQQMDQATQRNAALVEESAAAAEGLRNQAQQLVSAVAVFRLSPTDAAVAPAATAASA